MSSVLNKILNPLWKNESTDESSLQQDHQSFTENLIYSWNDITATANAPMLTVKSIWREITDMEPEMERTLRPISGASKSGELFAVIGGSGVGKTTLLNILSFRHSSRIHVGGDRCLSGVPVGHRVLQDISVFIPIEEAFYSEITIKEHLVFNAMLRTKFTTSLEHKMALVEDILQEYGLWKYRNEPIGNTQLPKFVLKMLSFATEATSNPSIVFCESPIFALESIDAFNVVLAMKRIARKGKIVISTFKGPTTEAFMQFDTVCIMAKGLVAFQGGVQEAFSFWEDLGYICPANYNPCEYFLCTLRIHRNRKEECAKKNENIVARFKETSMFKEIEKLSHRRRWKTIAMSRLERQLFHDRPPYRASIGCQTYWLLKRELSANFRAFFPFYGRLLLTIVMSIFYGMMFWDLQPDDNGVRSTVCFFCASIIQTLIAAGHCAIISSGQNMPALMNDSTKNVYRTFSYYIVKNICDIPACVVCPVVFVFISFPMIGLGTLWSDEVFYGCVTYTLATYIFSSLGMMCTAVGGSVLRALAMTHFDIVHLIFYSGLMMNTQTTLPVVGFLHNISISYQMMDTLMLVQFVKGNKTGQIAPSYGTTVHFGNGSNVMEYYGYNKDGEYWKPLGMLLLVCVIGFRILAFFPLVFRLYLHRKFHTDQ